MCYCVRCNALVLLDVVGSGCGALRCRMRVETEVDDKHLIVASCWFFPPSSHNVLWFSSLTTLCDARCYKRF